MNLDSEFFASLFGLTGAFLISMGYPIAFFFFLTSNIFFIRMGIIKKMKPFLVMQSAFTITSLIGIWNFLN